MTTRLKDLLGAVRGLLLIALVGSLLVPQGAADQISELAPTPPLGWNSWESYGTTIKESEVKANAEAIASKLKQFGWQYIVVDIQWYEPNAQAHERGNDRLSLLTHDEQQTMMTLWAIFRSPLIFGGDLPTLDPFTLSLLTNSDVTGINQSSDGNHMAYSKGDLRVWTASSSPHKSGSVAATWLSLILGTFPSMKR